MEIKYLESDFFKKDFKKLLKRFRTLKEDLNTAKNAAIELFHFAGINNQNIVKLPGFSHAEIKIYKLRKVACKALKGREAQSGIRIIYAFNESKFTIEFIEIYFKVDQESEDHWRIEEWLRVRVET